MAGLRAGALYGRPDLLAKVTQFGTTRIPVTAAACAAASLKLEPKLTKERLTINKEIRDMVFAHLDKIGASYIPSHTNFFMLSVKGMTAAQIGAGMTAKKIGLAGANRWPEWPQHIRVTVGTMEEMTKFNAAIAQVVKEGPAKA
jgi:histidinol-phosphate/aromatic aminotransferase/cobyric acid decarboxylase-like protein